MADYSKMTDQEFDDILCELVADAPPIELFNELDIWDMLSETFRDRVLSVWQERNHHKAYSSATDDKCPVCVSPKISWSYEGDCDPGWFAAVFSCMDCGAVWENIYTFDRVDNVESNRKATQ